MAAEPCSEHAGGDMSKDSVKKDKKKKKKREGKKREDEAEKKGQKQELDASVESLVAEGDPVEEKHSSKSKKSKRKRDDAGEASAGDEVVTSKGKKRKKEHPVALEEGSQKQTFHTAVENLVAERDKVEEKQSSKSKKNKAKRNDAGEAASGGDEVVTREGKKRKKKKEGDKSSPEFCEDASAGGEEADVDGKDDVKKKKSKEGTLGGIKEKEKAARSKNKGKRVSFADSAEVFRIEGDDGEEKGGGKKKKKKTAKSKNKGKTVSFADSKNKEGTEGSDDGEGGSSDKSKFVHGKRFTPEEDATLMEAIRDFMEMKQLGEEGLEMLRSRSRTKPPELKDCWTEIGKSLPHRPRTAIYMRAHILLSRSNERKWTQEEKEYIRR